MHATGWKVVQKAGAPLVRFLQKPPDPCLDVRCLRFSTGFSYGGAMSLRIACSRGKEFCGVAVLGVDPVAYSLRPSTACRTWNILATTMGKELRDRFVRNNG